MFVLVRVGEGPVACSKNKKKLFDKMDDYPEVSMFHIYVVDEIK